MNGTYVKYEMLRLLRNKRSFFFSLAFPLALFLVFGGSTRGQQIDFGSFSIGYTLYYMVGLAGYGAMIASVSGGARIATERTAGWTRQLRLTPLPVFTYFRTKVLTAYLMALISIVLIFAAGIGFGVRISPFSRWLEMTGLMLVALLPFIALGILVGHLLTPDSIGPAIGGGSAFFGFLGGAWFPLQHGSVLAKIGEYIPSYWLTQASHTGIGGNAWAVKGWLVIAAWTVVASLLAAQSYRRDTQRV